MQVENRALDIMVINLVSTQMDIRVVITWILIIGQRDDGSRTHVLLNQTIKTTKIGQISYLMSDQISRVHEV